MPIINNKSFVYQETPNNYSNIEQKINGQQMLTIKKFRKQSPSEQERADYAGQIGVGNKDDGSPLVWIANIGPNSINGWDLISTGPYSDEFAHRDKANNFANRNQTIGNDQIPYIQQGILSVDNIAIKGVGHMYINIADPVSPIIHIACAIAGGGFEWVLITDHTITDNVVMKNAQNNFKDGRQTILNQSIATVNPSLNRPTTPVRSGEFFLKKGDVAKGEKPQMWVSSSTAIGGFEWTPVSYSLDEDLVYRNKRNNFTEPNQTIVGKQIMTFATRGDQPPVGYKADYDGQFYVAFKTLSGGNKDVAVWVASGQTWIPLTQNLDPSKVVLTNKENVFTVANQSFKIGDRDNSQITGARIKLGRNSPIADSLYKATMLGEVCIYKNDSVVPSEISIWVAISINPNPATNAGEWTMIYSSKFDQTKIAMTDKANTFDKPQKVVGFGNHEYDFMSSRLVYDEGSPVGRVVPFGVGETFMIEQEQPGGRPDDIQVFMSTKSNDSTRWIKIYDKPIEKIVRSNEQTFFTEKLFLGAVTDTKRKRVIGAREKPDGTVYNTTAPTQLGETVMCTEKVGKDDWVVIYMCAFDPDGSPPGTLSRKNWIEIGRRKKSELVPN